MSQQNMCKRIMWKWAWNLRTSSFQRRMGIISPVLLVKTARNCCSYYHPCGGRSGRSDHRHHLEYARCRDAAGRCDHGSIHPVGGSASEGQRKIVLGSER